ncbi:MAG: hypothetical protein C4589_04585 [Peptococcaceae bacterium]|nr:MAG: hypothetical protein C4589_04585 [Peptococcaceae bacterium]
MERLNERTEKLNEKGFTFLEIIIIIAILGFLTAMAVPFAGRLAAAERVDNTQKRLENIRTAILGTPDAFDAEGRRVLRGYLGDMGRLPALYRSGWNDEEKRWEWSTLDLDDPEYGPADLEYAGRGLGQPRGLWEKAPAQEKVMPNATVKPAVDLGERWHGPYLNYPKDEFTANAEHLRWTESPATQAQRDENREFEMRQTEGKLADSWGRSLLFYYLDADGNPLAEPDAGATLYVVSEGPDKKSSHPAYSQELDYNQDNLVLVITPDQWHDNARKEKTLSIMEEIRDAIAGSGDPTARASINYVNDQGDWPYLYEWDGGAWVDAAAVSGWVYGHPRGLWTPDPDGDGADDLPVPEAVYQSVYPGLRGFGWRGPYYPPPAGEGENNVLRDAWGTPLQFVHPDEENPATFEIISAGPDGSFDDDDADVKINTGDARAGDNITLTLNRNWDMAMDKDNPNKRIEGRLINESGNDYDNRDGDSSNDIKIRLHAIFGPAGSQPEAIPVAGYVYGLTVNGATYGREATFAIPDDALDPISLRASYRYLEVLDSSGKVLAEANAYVYRAGNGDVIQSPDEHGLKLVIR